MRILAIIKWPVLLSLAVLSASLPILPLHAADQSEERPIPMMTTPIKALGLRASGAADDTLKACLARIPDEGTSGQRLLAEQSCKDEEATRKLVPLAPKF